MAQVHQVLWSLAVHAAVHRDAHLLTVSSASRAKNYRPTVHSTDCIKRGRHF